MYLNIHSFASGTPPPSYYEVKRTVVDVRRLFQQKVEIWG